MPLLTTLLEPTKGVLTLAAGSQDPDRGLRIGLTTDAFPRLKITPLGAILTGDGTIEPANSFNASSATLTPASPAPISETALGTVLGTTGATSQGYRNALRQMTDMSGNSVNDALISQDIVFQGPAARTVTDAVISSTSLTSVTAAFTQNDVGASVTGTNIDAPRNVDDAVFNSGSATVTSATANFTAADTGRVINPRNVTPTTGGPQYSVIPAGATITFVNSTTVTMSAVALASATGFRCSVGRGTTIASVQSPTAVTLNQPGAAGSAQTVTITTTIRTTGTHAKVYTPPDNGGDTSPFLGVQTGGGSGASFYKLGYLKPGGFADYSSSAQGAMEAGTGDQAQAGLFMSGYNPLSYINAGMTLMASNAIKARLDSPVAKGILISPADGTFDGRAALTVGTQVLNGADTNVKFQILLTGAITGLQETLVGAGQATTTPSTVTGLGGSLSLQDTGGGANSGGMLMFGGTSGGNFAAIKGLLANGANNTTGDLAISTRAATTDATLTQRISFTRTGTIVLSEGVNFVFGTATGTQIGTATSQKLGFYGATAVIQPAGTVDVVASLVTLGLRAATSNPPLNLGTGQVTSGAVVSSAAVTSSSPTAGAGYATGAGGTVTQATSRTTGVTLSKVCGQITTNTTSLAAGATARFTVTNTAVAATDNVVVSIKSGTTTDQTDVKVQAVAAGSFDLVVANRHATTAEVGAIIINYAVVKAVTA